MPLTINRMHAWTVVIQSADGTPITGANVAVDGGMPAHDHGLPTAPRVTREVQPGEYVVEGVRFHMGGDWQLTFAIDAGGVADSVTFDLTL